MIRDAAASLPDDVHVLPDDQKHPRAFCVLMKFRQTAETVIKEKRSVQSSVKSERVLNS